MRLSAAIASIAFVSVLGIARANDDAVSDEVRWTEVVQTFAATLDGSAERSELAKIVTAHSWVAPFARNRSEAVTVLPERLAGLKLIGAHAYLQPSVSAATDLIADVNGSAIIAPSVRKRIVPPNDKDHRAANATMARWFATALEAEPGDPVALIALYDPGHTTPESSASPTIVLVIARGGFRSDGTMVITRVLYGSLDAAVR